MQYYYAEGDIQHGPFEKPDLAGRGLGPGTLVWREGLEAWLPAGALPELSDIVAAPAAYAPPASYAPPVAQPEYATPAGYAAPDAGGPLDAGAPQLAYGGYAPATTPPQGMAITSLVLGISSIPLLWFYCVGLPCAVVAVVLGHIARMKVRRNEGGGAGMALAGLICGYAAIALTAAGVLFIVIAFSTFKMN